MDEEKITHDSLLPLLLFSLFMGSLFVILASRWVIMEHPSAFEVFIGLMR